MPCLGVNPNGSGMGTGAPYTNSRSGPRTSLGHVTLTVGVVLGPVWGLLHSTSRGGPRTSLGSVILTVGVVLGPV